MKAIILPGNNDTPITSNWYQSVKAALEKLGLEVIAEEMPDARVARKSVWIPFIKEKLAGEEDAILIGHSSGATAILSFLEEKRCGLAILVGASHTDLGDALERQSGYFDAPWKWEQIQKNAQKIIVFASQDDPYIPVAEARFIKEQVDAEYHEYTDAGHFDDDSGWEEFPELVKIVNEWL